MRILILGAGVIGITTAYYLAKSGIEVTVLDRKPAPALETSFANGGQLSYAHAEPWAHPTIWAQLPRLVFSPNSPFKISNRFDYKTWDWCLRFMSNAHLKKNQDSTQKIYNLAMRSRNALYQIMDETGIEFHHNAMGKLHIFGSKRDYKAAIEEAEFKHQLGCKYELANKERCFQIEPALRNIKKKMIGGVFYPDDEAGDIHKFTQALADYCQKYLGVNFLFNQSINEIKHSTRKIESLITNEGDELRFDAYVCCLGAYSGLILDQLGIKHHIYPLKGYSLTIPYEDINMLPKVSITVADQKIVCTSLGNSLRVAGLAEMAGYNTDFDPKSDIMKRFYRYVCDVFSDVQNVDKDTIKYWSCLRSATPDALPMIGRTLYKNFWLNTGQGTLGWTLSCGSAELLRDLMLGSDGGGKKIHTHHTEAVDALVA